MESKETLEPFRAAIDAIQHLLMRHNQRGVIIGGIAVSFLGKPRLTEDVDAMILLSTDEIPRFLAEAEEEGILPRISDAEKFAAKNRVLLLQHSASGMNIDITLGVLPFEEEVIQRSTIKSIGSLAIRLPSPEDLIIMKAVAHRPKDLDDIRTIFDNNPRLDQNRIKKWIQSFAEILEMPSLWSDISGLFQ